MSDRDRFLENVRRALGRDKGRPAPDARGATGLYRGAPSVDERALSIMQEAQDHAAELMSSLGTTAAKAGWKVARVASAPDAAEYIEKLARGLEARTILRTTHAVTQELDLEARLSTAGIDVGVMSIGDETDDAKRDEIRGSLRERAIDADIGVTGVDYALAETGTCVLLARKGVSRLVSLLPPVHVALVRPGEVLPGLDELFALRRQDLLGGGSSGYMNLITGPSRSADIEYTLVTGVHGPGEVHMLLLG